jgi:hypothetical protein
MNRKPFSKIAERGEGKLPLPSRTHPQKLNLAVYTEELTYLLFRAFHIVSSWMSPTDVPPFAAPISV